MSQATRTVLLGVLMLAVAGVTTGIQAQQAKGGEKSGEEISRRAKTKVQPAYPDLARKMNITGIVKVEVVVAPNGSVKDARVVGGHPVLANAALEAVKKWRFEPAVLETSGIIDFKFEPR